MTKLQAQKFRKYQARVKKGMAWLNKAKPSWRRKITLDELRLSDGRVCMVGQVFGHFREIVVDLEEGEKPRKGQLTEKQAIPMGFLESDLGEDYDLLTEVWKWEIAKYDMRKAGIN